MQRYQTLISTKECVAFEGGQRELTFQKMCTSSFLRDVVVTIAYVRTSGRHTPPWVDQDLPEWNHWSVSDCSLIVVGEIESDDTQGGKD